MQEFRCLIIRTRSLHDSAGGLAMSNPALAVALVGLIVASAPRSLQDKKFEYNKQAELDAEGNVYVSSDKGNLIKMADRWHCLEVEVADDKQTVGCMVRLKSEEPPQSLQLEIYLKGGGPEEDDWARNAHSGLAFLEWRSAGNRVLGAAQWLGNLCALRYGQCSSY